MAVGQKLTLRQSQSLALTPGLRQSIELMLLSGQDLLQLVDRKLEENPFLERERPDGDGARDDASGDAGASGDEGAAGDEAAGDYLAEPGFERGLDATGGFGDGDDLEASAPSLEVHLTQEARLVFADPRELAIASALIAELDEAGYLPAEPLEGRLPPATLEPVLRRLQGLAPPGCFARSLAECLALQLEDRGLLDAPFRRLLENLPLVAAGERKRLQKASGLEADALDDRLALLRNLDPKPALSFNPPQTVAVIPDLLVSLDDSGRPRVRLNQEALPRLRVNLQQRRALKGRLRKPEDRRYVSERAAEAGWLVRSLVRRGRSLLTLGQEIVSRQEAFFRGGGFASLRPLTRRSLAEAVGLSEASISRLVANKAIAAPQGVLPLARFFSPPTAGGRSSQAAATARLARLIGTEAPEAPLSDRQLAERLAGEGLVLARRTVAKYRESLNIPGSAARRRRARLDGRRTP